MTAEGTPTDASRSESEPPGGLLVKLPTFEGPLDLLLHLIRKQQIDIKDIPIVQVTEQYIEYLNLMKELNLDLAGEYLVMAATLIHIKSKMLLPVQADDTEDPYEDPRADLVRQLLEYEKFKKVSDVLYERDRIERACYPSGASAEFETEEETLLEVSLFDLVGAFKRLLDERKQVTPYTIHAYQESVSERVAALLEDMATRESMSFEELFPSEETRERWIVTFLALLELARLRAVVVVQKSAYGEIVIMRRDEPPPAGSVSETLGEAS